MKAASLTSASASPAVANTKNRATNKQVNLKENWPCVAYRQRFGIELRQSRNQMTFNKGPNDNKQITGMYLGITRTILNTKRR